MAFIKPTLVIGSGQNERFHRICFFLRRMDALHTANIYHHRDLDVNAFKDYLTANEETFSCKIEFVPMMNTNTLPKTVSLHSTTADDKLVHLFLNLNGSMMMVNRLIEGIFEPHEEVILDVEFERVVFNVMFDEYAIQIGQ